MDDLGRRDLLKGAGALVALHAAGLSSPVAAGAAPDPAFAWGVASFDPTATSVLLWTRLAVNGSPPVDLGWTVARDEALTDVAASGSIEVSPATDGCATVEATGLSPDGTWWYAFTTEDGARSPVGRTRTMPTEAVERLRLGVVSCSRYASGGFAAYRALAGREVDLVVHVGDYIYEDGKAGERPHEPPEELLALDQYRARYAQHRLDPDLQALHARHPMVAVWDDHEIAGNAWSGGAPGHDEATDGPWIDRLRAAGQAYSEWLPGRTSRSSVDGRLQAWRALSLGGLAELVVLDTRSWGRDRQPASAAELGGPPEGGAPGSARTILGEDQMRFATERLAGTGRAPRPPWVLVANQVMFHPLEVPVPVESLAQAVEDEGFLVVDGKAVNPDQWDGYPQDRDRLVEAVGDQGGVVVLTGDVHSSWAWEGPATVAGGGPAMVELVTPSVSTEALADRLPVPAGAVEAALSGLSDDLSHVELSSHGYLLVDLDADRVQGEWWYVDPDDPSSARFGAARSTSRAAPMRLTEVDEPLPEPQARSAPTPTPRGTARAPSSEPDDDDDRTALVAGAGAVAVTALAGAAVALRRRRPHPSP